MLHHYLQKGFAHEYILNLSNLEKVVYKASMELALEEEAERMKALSASFLFPR